MAQSQQHQPSMIDPSGSASMHQPVGDFVYSANRYHDGREWMLADMDMKTFACKWTTNPSKSLIFHTQEEAKDLIEMFPVLAHCHIGRQQVGG